MHPSCSSARTPRSTPPSTAAAARRGASAPGSRRDPSASDERREIEALLRRPEAIRPVFQPLVELATGRIGGYEALSRICGDRRPDQWFLQAHRVGLGPELEAAALRAALAVPGRPASTFLALNVSPVALLTPVVQAALPADLSKYVIELTEHELFAADAVLDEVLDAMRLRGARVALDDAGAGYAGLQQLIRVAPDILKLDRSLVHGAHADPSRVALIEALASFAADTGAAVCGEGVEDLEDLRALARVDVTYAQGYAVAGAAAHWPRLAPGVAGATSSPLRHGVRVAEEAMSPSRHVGTRAGRAGRRPGGRPGRGRRARAPRPRSDAEVPVGLGDDEPGLLEVYRRQAQAFTAGEIDRARVVALQFAAVLRRL